MPFFTNILTIYCLILFIFQTNSQWQGPYRIRGVGSNRCLDIAGSHRHNGRRLQIWDCHNGANQKWYINKRTRQFRIGSKHGKCLDVHGSHYNRRRNGAKLQAWTCHRGQNQRFRFSGRHIRSEGKMAGKCLDVWRAKRHRGQKVILWPCHRGSNQQWKLEYVGRHKQPRPNKRCPNVLIQRRRIQTRKSQRLGHINFENNMVISLDVTLRAWPRGHWINIIHCGNRNTIRQPALFVNRNGKYFHVVYGTTRNWNKLKNTGRIRLNRKYKIQWRVRRDRYDVYIDGKRWYSVRGRHRNHQRQQCYLGDPWHGNPNAIVENLKIVRGTDPNGGCRRRKRRRVRRRRKRKKRGRRVRKQRRRVRRRRRRRRRPRRRRRRRKRKKRGRRVRKRRRKKRRSSGWKCVRIRYRDYVRKRCIRKRPGRAGGMRRFGGFGGRYMRSKKFRRQRHGFKEGYRMGRKAALRAGRMRGMARNNLIGMGGGGGLRGPVPRPPRIRLVNLKGRM